MKWLIASLALCSTLGCATLPIKSIATPPRAPITLTYLGVAGWRISDGKSEILVDPYFSRGAVSAARAQQTVLVSDNAAIAGHVPARVNVIVVGHSHADHLLDVPTIAALTGAQIIGSSSTTNYARASGIKADHLITVKGGEDYQFNGFSIPVIPGLHSALDDKHGLDPTRAIAADVKPPLRFSEFAEGGTLDYLVRLGGHEILVISSANYIERELEGLRPDVVIAATGLREEIYDYSCRLVRALGNPPLVLANHFDDWQTPLDLDTRLSLDDQRDLAAFAAEIKRCSPRSNVVVPAHGKEIVIQGGPGAGSN